MVAIGFSSYDIALNFVAFKVGQLTQILECFGVTFADNFGILVIVKDPNQLPRVTVITVIGVICGFMVIGNTIANFLAICNQLFVI